MTTFAENQYSFFSHKKCEYFPCHATDALDDFNCLFCFCPLYFGACDGNFTIAKNGVKDCGACQFPHRRENYEKIIKLLRGNYGT